VTDDLDRQLVAKFAGGRDPAAFGALYERHSAYLYRFALRLTAGDIADAEDLVHDAWMRAVESLSAFKWRSSLRAWLGGILVNVARSRWRVTARDMPLEDDHAADDEPLRGTFDRVDLQRALSALAPGFRMVLLLHDVEGYTHEEIGRALEIDAGTSKSQLSRARAAMRRALGAVIS